MENSSKRYRVSSVISKVSIFVLLVLAFLYILPHSMTGMKFPSMLEMIKKISGLVKQTGMAQMHLILLYAWMAATEAGVIAGAIVFLIMEAHDLAAKKCGLEKTAGRFVRLAFGFYGMRLAYQFYQTACDSKIQTPSVLPVIFCLLLVLLIGVISFLADKQDNMVRSYHGRILSLVIFVLGAVAAFALQLNVFTLQQDDVGYKGLYGSYSMITLPADTFGYIEWVYEEEKVAVNAMTERGEEIDRINEENGENIDRAEDKELQVLQQEVVAKNEMAAKMNKLKWEILILVVFLVLLLSSYSVSLKNFSRGMCGSSFGFGRQMVWNGVLVALPWIYLMVYRGLALLVIESQETLNFNLAFVIPIFAGLLFGLATGLKMKLDGKELRMNRAVETVKNQKSGKSAAHYQQMFGDKPLSEYEHPQMAFTRRQERSGKTEENKPENRKKTAEKSSMQEMMMKRDTIEMTEETDNGKDGKMVPKSVICINCGAENKPGTIYCSVCRKRIDD